MVSAAAAAPDASRTEENRPSLRGFPGARDLLFRRGEIPVTGGANPGNAMTNVYLLCATLGLAFVAITALFGFIGGGDAHDSGGHAGTDVDASAHVSNDFGAGGHGDASGDAGGHGGVHLPVFSPMVLAAYVTGFGGSGLIYRYLFGDRPILHVPLAAVTGLGLGVGVAYFSWRLISFFESARMAREQDAYAQDAEVAVAIPDGGFGEVAYVSGGARQSLPARAELGSTFRAGDRVRIVRITGGTALVRPVTALPGYPPPEAAKNRT